MYKDNLFEFIRNEEVIIWAGAGISLYAGYPSGKELVKILYNHLTKIEKENIPDNLPLPILAEQIIRAKNQNRNFLINILKKTFIDKKPISTICHENISKIPHIHTIITTNYDNLFEDTYKQNGQVIYSAKQIPYLEHGKTHIFKVHGDLQNPDSIIITESDYHNFFKKRDENNVYWTVIKERLSTKNVLFLGYNLEDPNVSIVFDKITDELGANRKDCFLVAPNLNQYKINDLSHKGINYINSTAKDLIEELTENIKGNIKNDLESGKISADTFRRFLSNFNLLSELEGKNDVFKLKSLRGKDNKIDGKINLSFKNEKEFIKKVNDFFTGKKVGTFEISKEHLIDGEVWLGGLKLINSGELSKIKFESIPTFTNQIDLRFEDGFEYNNIPIKIFNAVNLIEIHIELPNANFTIKLVPSGSNNAKTNFTFKHNKNCIKVNNEINLFRILNKLCKGELCTIFINNGKLFSRSFSEMKPLLKESSFYLQYFNNLKTIEKHYEIQFSDFEFQSINKKTYDNVLTILSVINSKKRKFNWDIEIKFGLKDSSDQTIEKLKRINHEGTPIVAFGSKWEEIELHGQKISLGHKVIELIEPNLTNIDSFVNKKDDVIRMKSKVNKVYISYTDKNDPN